jgi:hypothetical protein
MSGGEWQLLNGVTFEEKSTRKWNLHRRRNWFQADVNSSGWENVAREKCLVGSKFQEENSKLWVWFRIVKDTFWSTERPQKIFRSWSRMNCSNLPLVRSIHSQTLKSYSQLTKRTLGERESERGGGRETDGVSLRRGARGWVNMQADEQTKWKEKFSKKTKLRTEKRHSWTAVSFSILYGLTVSL